MIYGNHIIKFSLVNNICRQIDGVAMGSNLGLILVDIVKGKIVKQKLNSRYIFIRFLPETRR